MSPKHMFRNDYGKGIGLIRILFVIALGELNNTFFILCAWSSIFLGPCGMDPSSGWTRNPFFCDVRSRRPT